MRYTSEEAMAEIMRRSERVASRRSRRSVVKLTAFSGILFAALLSVIAIIPKNGVQSSSGSVYGAFLLSREAGGYVLASLIAFALGVAVTLLCLRYRKKNQGGTSVKELLRPPDEGYKEKTLQDEFFCKVEEMHSTKQLRNR